MSQRGICLPRLLFITLYLLCCMGWGQTWPTSRGTTEGELPVKSMQNPVHRGDLSVADCPIKVLIVPWPTHCRKAPQHCYQSLFSNVGATCYQLILQGSVSLLIKWGHESLPHHPSRIVSKDQRKKPGENLQGVSQVKDFGFYDKSL